MPLLDREVSLNPPDLLTRRDDRFAQDDFGGDDQWWALYTFARREKSLMRRLYNQQLHFYCPMVTKAWKSGGTSRRSHLPLFPGYVFLRGDESARHAAICSGHVARHLPISHPGPFLDQLRGVQRLIDSGLPLELEPRIPVGVLVRVKSGSLEGVLGRVCERRGGSRLVVHVDFLQQGASLDVEAFDLEVV